MFGRKANKLANDLAVERNLLLIEIGEKDEKIARLDAEAQRLAERVRDLRAAEAKHMKAMAQQVRATEEAQHTAKVLTEQLQGKVDQAAHYREALQEIRGMATPGANATVKRMAAKAEYALQTYASVQAEAA